MDAGISFSIDTVELDRLVTGLARIVAPDLSELAESIGALGESQTRRRIDSEKTAPEGTPWKPNRAGTPTLKQTGVNLLDSIAFVSDGSSATWGASWEYAHIHQEGAVIEPRTAEALRFQGPKGVVFARKVTIPGRPFIGLSSDNRREIEELVTDFTAGLFDDGAWRGGAQ